MIDQGASSLTNFLVVVFASREISPAELGRFAAVLLVYQVVTGLLRGVVSEPVSVRWSAHSRSESIGPVGDSLGASITLSLAAGVPLAVVGLLTGGPFATQMLLLAVMLPGLQLQDAVRFAALTWKRPAVAAATDGLWLALMVVGGVGVTWLSDPQVATPYLVVWGVSGIIAGPVGLMLLRVTPRPSRTWNYLQTHRSLAVSYGFESLAQRGAPRLATATVGLFDGVREFAGLRGALLFGTQLSVLNQAVRLVMIPESVRGGSAEARAAIAMRATKVLSGVTIVGSAVLLSVPDSVGRQLLGETWILAEPLLFWVLLRSLFAAIALGPEIAMRAMANPRFSLRSRLANSILLVAGGFGGAALDGARGAAVGMAIGQAVSTMLWLLAYRRLISSARAEERMAGAST